MENHKNHPEKVGWLSLQPGDVPVDWDISIFPDSVPEVPLSELHVVPSDEEIMNDIWHIVDAEIGQALANIRF